MLKELEMGADNQEMRNRAQISATVAELAKNENLPSQGVMIQQTNHSTVPCLMGAGIGAAIGGAAGFVTFQPLFGAVAGAMVGCGIGTTVDNIRNGNESIIIKPIPASPKPTENTR